MKKRAEVPLSFKDYEVSVDEVGLPGAVQLQRRLGSGCAQLRWRQ